MGNYLASESPVETVEPVATETTEESAAFELVEHEKPPQVVATELELAKDIAFNQSLEIGRLAAEVEDLQLVVAEQNRQIALLSQNAS